MSNTRWDMDSIIAVASTNQAISSATTSSFDFGTPDDINTADLPGYVPGARLLVVLTASATGTTDSLTWVIQDAPDNGSGSIGSTATAVTNVVSGALAAGTGSDCTVVAVKIQPGRPWIRIRATSNGANDTFTLHATVLQIPNNA